ncbi:tRNA lysidine(34) synthetase TilS [Anaeromicrobium sediminis]|uniref:tRNA(Ile)-lysidine synthase n=1 Tax=Anaeromicrobium sediminis TaxID=1478221 RepID=A0A267MDE8_9FIRM|nr:tRNA lysidine(34) synthetase TilS [Anaeromicrobium sediminis]PAB57624.1 tRNA lysidine(34) synthetase TilS [Anaeromicrobium sediminis]
MLEKFLQTIEEYNLIEVNEKIVVGVSGGPDSISLLHLLFTIKEKYNIQIYGVHLNHKYRGKEADEDAQYVHEFCTKLKIPCYVYSENVEEYSKKKGRSFEEGGRELRYKYFYEVLRKVGAKKIAVAQNLDDQAETMLMRFMRGSGIEGLCAMDYKRDEIIRPILNIRRKEIEKYCERHGLNPRIDKTNLESIYTRNRIRLELIPYISEHFNRNIKETLFRTSELIREDKKFLDECVKESYNRVIKEEVGKVIIDRLEFNKCHKAIQRRIIRECILYICSDLKNIEKKHVEELIKFIGMARSGSTIDLPKNLISLVKYEKVVIKKRENSKNKDFLYPVEIGKKIYIEELNGYIYGEIVSMDEYNSSNNGKYNMYFDFNETKELFIRNRRNGDKFKPLGLNGTKKLKDYFIDEKIPKDERSEIPILVSDDEILWVVGYRRSSLGKVKKNSERILRVSYIQE